MKILIQNYASAMSTEPMYINRCLQECGFNSELWGNPNVSAFDMFDGYGPDMFITHYKFLTNDIVKYLSQKRSIHMVMNLTGINNDEFNVLETMVKDYNLNVPLTFTNLYDTNVVPKSDLLKVIDLYPAADIFLAPSPTPEYASDACVISVTENNIADEFLADRGNYHKFSFDANAEYSDLNLDVASMSSFYGKYKEIILADDINFVTSQILFDAILKSDKVSIKVTQEQQPMLNNILSKIFVQEDKDIEISKMVKSQVRSRHNCFKRCARLFRSLRMEEASKRMEDISKRLSTSEAAQ